MRAYKRELALHMILRTAMIQRAGMFKLFWEVGTDHTPDVPAVLHGHVLDYH